MATNDTAAPTATSNHQRTEYTEPSRGDRVRVASAILRRALSAISPDADRAGQKIAWAGNAIDQCNNGFMCLRRCAEDLAGLRHGWHPKDGDESGWVAWHAIHACQHVMEA